MKKKLLFLTLILASFSVSLTSCSKVEGCTYADADNYDPEADENDGSCRCSAYITFDNTTNEDYTITNESTGEKEVIAPYGTEQFYVSGYGDCESFNVTDVSNGNTYIGTRTQCACDVDMTITIY